MARQNKARVENYVLMPKKRWGRRILWWMMVLGVPLLALVVHCGRCAREDESLFAEILSLASLGEPMCGADFEKKARPIHGDNAAPLLRGAGSSIDHTSTSWNKIYLDEVRLPLTRSECETVRRIVEENLLALEMLAAARARKAAWWEEYFAVPMCDTWLRSAPRQQQRLAHLVVGKLLLLHQGGDDRDVMQCFRDLLMISRSMEQMLPGYSHEYAAGISTIACVRLIEIAPDLRIGTSESMADRSEVLKLIGELLDESSLVEGHLLHLRWQRANHAQTVAAVHNWQLRPSRWQLPLPYGVAMWAAKPDALADGRAILKFSTDVLRAAERSDDWVSFNSAASDSLSGIQSVERNSGWQSIARPEAPSYHRIVKEHYMQLAERRLAAAALAIRLYVVEHEGQFPQSLEELTPTYLPRVPADPMALKGQKIRYVQDERRPIIYSIGENGWDDDGSEEVPHKWMPRRMWWGADAVAHLKRQKRERNEHEIYHLGHRDADAVDADDDCGDAEGGY